MFDCHMFSVTYFLHKEDAAIPHGSRRIIQDRDRGFEPPSLVEKEPQPFHRIRQHHPRQVLPCQRATDADTQPFFGPHKPERRDGSVAVRRDDVFDDLILRFGDELEECLEVYQGPVFAEDERRGGIWDAHLEGIYGVVVGAF